MTDRPPPGPVAEEAARLVEVALGWARRATAAYGEASPGSGRRADASSPGSAEPVEHGGHVDDGTCRACPLCRASAALRDPSPELGERLTTAVTDAALALAEVLRVLSDAGVGGDRGGPAPQSVPRRPPGAEPGAPAAPAGDTRVERIDIQDD